MASLVEQVNELSLDRPKITRPVLSREDDKLRLYLLQHSNAFVVVDELRERGWNSPAGDALYQKKHEIADKRIKDKSEEMVYYQLYRKIAQELQTATGAFTIQTLDDGDLRGLNLCMAPGGYTKALLDHNPKMTISGTTLGEDMGGHPVIPTVADDPRVKVEYLDINLLAPAMGISASEIPADHPDAGHFLTEIPFAGQEFDVVIADGAVLRTHTREEYREKERESLRLRILQLAYGLERIKKGGSMIFLSHRIDSWDNFALLRSFEQFSKVKVHKPKQQHVQSSSWYLIAKDVKPDHPEAVALVKRYKLMWRQATFGGKDGKGEIPEGPTNEVLTEAIKEYGPRFIKLGTPVWTTQSNALRHASYMKPRHPGFYNKPQPREDVGPVWPWAKASKDVTGDAKGFRAGSWRDRAPSGLSGVENEKPCSSVSKSARSVDNADVKKQSAATGSSWW